MYITDMLKWIKSASNYIKSRDVIVYDADRECLFKGSRAEFREFSRKKF